MTLLLYARQLAPPKGVYWRVPNFESAIGVVRTYHEGGHRGNGIHRLYAQTLGAKHLGPRAAINIVVTPSQWIIPINVQVDAATREEPQAGLTWMLCRPYAFLPRVKFQDRCQLAPTDLQEWLHEKAAIRARVHYEHRWGPNDRSLDWFTSDQQHHLAAHRMCNLPTMTVLVERSGHHNVRLCTRCLLCNSGLETARHLWEHPVQSHKWCLARQHLRTWLSIYVGPRASRVHSQLWDSEVLEPL